MKAIKIKDDRGFEALVVLNQYLESANDNGEGGLTLMYTGNTEASYFQIKSKARRREIINKIQKHFNGE